MTAQMFESRRVLKRSEEKKSNLRQTMKRLPLLMIVALAGASMAGQSPVEGFANKPMPKFQLVDTHGAKLTNASLKGKVYLMDFWATWCGPCKAAMPTMQRLHNKYKSKGFMVIGTNILEHTEDKPSVAAKFQKAAKLTYLFAKNTPQAENLADRLQIQGIPTFLLVDKKGIVRKVQVGFNPAHEAELAKQIEALLK
jgi:thiol-disulfide isomerase/thioredoxin